MTNVLSRIAIEPARVTDVDLVAPLFDAYRQFYGMTADLPAARAFLAARLARDQAVVLLARIDAPRATEAVAFAQLYPSFSSLALGPTVVLNDLFVATAWRRLGIASRLMEAVETYARSVGAVRIDLATQHGNWRALGLYEKRGFAQEVGFAHLSLALRRDDSHPTVGRPGRTVAS